MPRFLMWWLEWDLNLRPSGRKAQNPTTEPPSPTTKHKDFVNIQNPVVPPNFFTLIYYNQSNFPKDVLKRNGRWCHQVPYDHYGTKWKAPQKLTVTLEIDISSTVISNTDVSFSECIKKFNLTQKDVPECVNGS